MNIMDVDASHPAASPAQPAPGGPPAVAQVAGAAAEAPGEAAGEVLEARCEEVRAHLVAARGGAPFLSGADGRLLLRWVEGGVPLPAILSAIDAAVERRRRRPVRGRLSLSACGKELERWTARAAPSDAAPAAPAEPLAAKGALTGYLAEVAALQPGPPFGPTHARLVEELSESADLEAIEEAAAAAMRAIRRFHEGCWEALAEGRAALLTEAEAGFEPLRSALSPTTFAELVESTARDQVRARFPTLSAREVWDRLQPGAAA